MIEIQIVPSDIRRNVRYVFFDRRRVLVAICLLTVVLAAILGSMAAAPTVIRKVYKDNYVKSMRHSMIRLQQQLDLLSQYEAANAAMVRHTPSVLPVPADQFVLTSPFGMRISPFTRAADFHKGLDLSAPTGTPIYATADGIVSFAGQYPLRLSANWWRFGNVVVINHSDHFVTIYGHCDTIKIRRAQEVKQGQMIATVGNSGWSTNSHLHYEVRSDLEQPGTYVAIDPRIYILNYQWTNEANLLMRSRTSKEYQDFEPLPPSFTGKGEVVRVRSKGRGRRRA